MQSFTLVSNLTIRKKLIYEISTLCEKNPWVKFPWVTLTIHGDIRCDFQSKNSFSIGYIFSPLPSPTINEPRNMFLKNWNVYSCNLGCPYMDKWLRFNSEDQWFVFKLDVVICNSSRGCLILSSNQLFTYSKLLTKCCCKSTKELKTMRTKLTFRPENWLLSFSHTKIKMTSSQYSFLNNEISC